MTHLVLPLRILNTPKKMVMLLFLLSFILMLGQEAFTQDAVLPLNSPGQYYLERLQIQGDSLPFFHSSLKPYRRGDLFSAAYNWIGQQERRYREFDQNYVFADNDEFFTLQLPNDSVQNSTGKRAPIRPESKAPLLGFLYAHPADAVSIDTRSFYLRANPILHFNLGREDGRDGLLFVNRRGVDLRGGIDHKVFFSTSIIETQLRPGSHVNEYVNEFRGLPDAGLFKDFDSRIFKGAGAYDYLNSSGYVGFGLTQHIGAQLGHGKNFIGDGYRSLFLSDFAKNYFFLKFNTRVWRFHYQNIFAELGATEKLPGNVVVPKKFLAAHYLSFLIRPNLSVGLFEAVMFARDKNQFELQYLNPVILYRSIEHHVGSPDNVLLGVSAHWDVAKTFRVYSQFIIDEFSFSEVLSSRGWWGNKNGLQLGVKYPDAFNVTHFDVQLEYNRVRPFTYSHYDSLGSYSHFNQPLAHPSGANFSEVLLNMSYRPAQRIWVGGKFFYILYGKDTEEVYYGSDILRQNTERNSEFGVFQRQGVQAQNLISSLTVSYMVRHNLFLEGQYFRRDFTSDDVSRDLLTSYILLGVRWNYTPSQTEF